MAQSPSPQQHLLPPQHLVLLPHLPPLHPSLQLLQ